MGTYPLLARTRPSRGLIPRWLGAGAWIRAKRHSDQTVKLWDLTTGQEVLSLKGHTHRVFGVAFSADGKRLASGGGERYGGAELSEVIIWDVETNQPLHSLGGHKHAVECVAFSPDGKRLATVGGKVAKTWDVATGKELQTFGCDPFGAFGVAFSPDGQSLAHAGMQGSSVW